MIEVKSLYKSYDSLTVLKDINITINKSEIVSIVGASGAGKTTLLQIIGTLDKADKGEVWINNKNINQLKDNSLSAFRNKEIGFVFQFHHLLPEFTALENVCIPAYIAKETKKNARIKAEELLDLLNLKDRINHKPSELSG
ncbi:MAG: ATP-binding cassette domain-containing protein, partial [Bacteroidales bacterium]|nr:ATP-binding cassette domain-containing protein [Bacteroidales bacterium]